MPFHTQSKPPTRIHRLAAMNRTLLASTAFTSMALAVMPAVAQNVSGTSPGLVELTQAAETQTFSIAPQPLASALDRFSEQTGISFAYTTSQLEDVQSPGVTGALTPGQALAQLLAGTGVTFQFTGADTVALERGVEQAGTPIVLDTIAVTGTQLTARVIGDQTSFSVIGERAIIDTPFSITGFTDELIENTASRSATDVLLRDPSVSQEVNSAGFQDGLSIRGFSVDFGSVLYDGVPGLDRRDGYFNVANLQRIEVFRGANAFNSGIGIFGGVGGTINLVPKRPEADPINKVTLGYEEDNSPFFAVDFSRRFGAEQQFGLRFNGYSQDNAGTVDLFERKTGTYSLYLDWRATDRLTLGGEITRFVDRSDGFRDNIFLADGVSIPDVPSDLSINYSQPWAFIEDSGYRYYANVRWEFLDGWALSAGGGMVEGDDDNGFNSAFGRLQSDDGTLTQFPFRRFRTKTDSYGAQVKLDGEFDLGSVLNRVTVGTTYVEDDQLFPGGPGATATVTSNLFDPVYVPEVLVGTIGEADASAEVTTILGLYEARFFDERVSALIGARDVQIETENSFINRSYDDSEMSLFGALSFKPVDNSLLYISYSEGLERGDTAPLTANNAGEELPPDVTSQIELGAKYELGDAIASIAAFRIERPISGLDGSNVFSEVGDQVHNGLELRLEGELVEGFRMIGGLSYFDAEIESNDPATDGNRPVGVPEWSAALYAEYDLPSVKGLTFSGGVRYEGDQFIDNQNFDNRKADSWIEVDLGARYGFEVADVPLTARLFVHNVFEEGYWGVDTNGGLQLSTPRIVSVSLSAEF